MLGTEVLVFFRCLAAKVLTGIVIREYTTMFVHQIYDAVMSCVQGVRGPNRR